MAEINWTAEAEQWLRDIYDYISSDKPEAARRVVEGIYEKVHILRRFPEVGHRYNRDPHLHIRILLYGHYRMRVATGSYPAFITVDPSGKFAYAANWGDSTVSVYTINTTTGAIQ